MHILIRNSTPPSKGARTRIYPKPDSSPKPTTSKPKHSDIFGKKIGKKGEK